MIRHLLFIFFSAFCVVCSAQSRLVQGTEYELSACATSYNGSVVPFWLTNNRYGLGTIEDQSLFLRARFGRDSANDSLYLWRIGYGADLVGGYGFQSDFVVQQLYADFDYKLGRLTVGQKERGAELKHPELSMGGLTLGTNSRPLPQLRIELPDFWIIPGTHGWLGFKGHLAYGWYTDNKWQETFNHAHPNFLYSKDSRFHSKAGFVRVGDKRRFPLTVIAGLEMASQFGGTVYNAVDREGRPYSHPQHLPSGIKAYWNTFFMGGSDINDGEPYANAAGNHVGSWHLRFDYDDKGWGASAYAEHFFEDHSQMFVQYGWKDMLYGIELRLPTNRFVSTIVYENLGTMHQSGPVYHDRTEAFPEQISGADNYYGNHVYGSWQHAGFVIGNPLILSPLYNNMNVSPAYDTEGSLRIFHNRVRVHHLGLAGDPHPEVHYRLIYTHQRSLGSYGAPTPDPVSADYLLAEGTYRPHIVPGLSVTLAYAFNRGTILRKSDGIMLTLKYQTKLL